MIKVQWQYRRWREEWDDADAAGADYGDDHDNVSQFPGYFTVENSIWGKKISLDNDERWWVVNCVWQSKKVNGQFDLPREGGKSEIGSLHCVPALRKSVWLSRN